MPLLVLIGLSEPGLDTAPMIQIEPELLPIVIDSKDTLGQRCLMAPTTQIIQRNLTLPYDQQTVYGTAQCQSDD
ncbi:MAG: hypothetical protein V3V22_10785 [Methylococcales bacterium]